VPTFVTTKYFRSIWTTGCVGETVYTRDNTKRGNRKNNYRAWRLKIRKPSLSSNIEISSNTFNFLAIVRIPNLSVRYPSASSALCASTVEPTREITNQWQEPIMRY
jgi:hypothetical protein